MTNWSSSSLQSRKLWVNHILKKHLYLKKKAEQLRHVRLKLHSRTATNGKEQYDAPRVLERRGRQTGVQWRVEHPQNHSRPEQRIFGLQATNNQSTNLAKQYDQLPSKSFRCYPRHLSRSHLRLLRSKDALSQQKRLSFIRVPRCRHPSGPPPAERSPLVPRHWVFLTPR